MDNLKEIPEIMRRASVASIFKSEKHPNKAEKEYEPKDILYLTHILFLLFGLLNVLPYNFFITANDYWMYKFRDCETDSVDLNNKTTLQKYFVSGCTVVETIVSAVTTLLATFYGHKIKVHLRMVWTLGVMAIIFFLFTMFIKINTDTWQLGFFIAALVGLSLLTGVLSLFQVTCLAVVPKFPQIYMKSFLFGRGLSSMFSATLQIISLAIGISTITSALIYFISGSSVVFLTLLLYCYVQNTSFYNYYFKEELEDTQKKHSKDEIKAVFKEVWPCLVTVQLLYTVMIFNHPSITALVASENYNRGSQWSDLYFVPTITFFLSDAISQLGRLVSWPFYTKANGSWLVGLNVLRVAILTPLVMFCNAQPRNYLPVLLPHDWEYILVIFVYFFSNGLLMNASYLSISELTDKPDVAFLILMSFTSVFCAVASPVGLLIVRIL